MLILDASTLILIAKAELLGPFLAGIKLEVVIPGEVEKECCGAKKTFDALLIQKALEECSIKVIPVKDRKLVARLQTDFSLGQGEAEAIALALKEKAQLLGIDDKNGINACKVLGIAFTTAIGILLRTSNKGLIDGQAAVAGLAALGRYGRYKNSIIEDAKKKLEERE
jgi:predicted nucleic acid-binding protein